MPYGHCWYVPRNGVSPRPQQGLSRRARTAPWYLTKCKSIDSKEFPGKTFHCAQLNLIKMLFVKLIFFHLAAHCKIASRRRIWSLSGPGSAHRRLHSTPCAGGCAALRRCHADRIGPLYRTRPPWPPALATLPAESAIANLFGHLAPSVLGSSHCFEQGFRCSGLSSAGAIHTTAIIAAVPSGKKNQ